MRSSKILGFALLLAVAAGSVNAQLDHLYTASTSMPIPSVGTGGAAGGIMNNANRTQFTITVTEAFYVGTLDIALDIQHAAVGDLVIQIAHCGMSIQLYGQTPASTADLNGVYNFSAAAATTFANAISTTLSNGTVPPGDYYPQQTASFFSPVNAAGDWVVTIYDLTGGNVGNLWGMSLNFLGGVTYAAVGPTGTIPDGASGSCVSPLTQAVTINTHGPVGDVAVNIPMTHTFIGDLDIIVQHEGVTVVLSSYSISYGGNVAGVYTFWDDGASWAAAKIVAGPNGDIPPGLYSPAQPLADFKGLDQFGLWFITVCDRHGQDVGSLGTCSIKVAKSPYDFAITQPNGSASVTLTNTGGVPGHAFANLFTLNQGVAPFGWLGGLDIAISDVVSQLNFGAPFTGVLGPCGTTALTINGPIPSGLQLWAASFELDPSGSPIAIEQAFSYTTQ